ncbi:MAG: DegV family protein [Christensenellales bacterium]
MKNYVLMTDSNTEIPWEFAEAHNIPVVRMPYSIGTQEYFYDLGKETDFKTFFDNMRQGAVPKTAILPPQFYVELWTPMLQAGQDILFICFSSKLSAAFSAIQMARDEVLQDFPDRKITLVDTKSISMGAGLLVMYAVEMYDRGAAADEIVAFLEEKIPKVQHWFTVDNLIYLKRTGRISSTAATMGTMLNVKPILSVDKEGALKSVAKAKGRKKAVHYLFDRLEEQVEDPENQYCVIVQADCMDEAQALKKKIEQRFNFKQIILRDIGPVVGSHAGPGSLALMFMGGERV